MYYNNLNHRNKYSKILAFHAFGLSYFLHPEGHVNAIKKDDITAKNSSDLIARHWLTEGSVLVEHRVPGLLPW